MDLHFILHILWEQFFCRLCSRNDERSLLCRLPYPREKFYVLSHPIFQHMNTPFLERELFPILFWDLFGTTDRPPDERKAKLIHICRKEHISECNAPNVVELHFSAILFCIPECGVLPRKIFKINREFS